MLTTPDIKTFDALLEKATTVQLCFLQGRIGDCIFYRDLKAIDELNQMKED
jgi:hypothetical protein